MKKFTMRDEKFICENCQKQVEKFKKMLQDYNDNPELINNGKDTAPSKRILKEINNYTKVIDGTMVSKQITINEIKSKCKHFSKWIGKLEQL